MYMFHYPCRVLDTCISFFKEVHWALSFVPCLSLYINDIRLFVDDYVCCRDILDTEDTLKLQKDRSIGMLGKEMGYEISTCQMQYDANNKETDKKDPCLKYFGGHGPQKLWKYQVSCRHYHQWFKMEYMSAIFAPRIIGCLASWDKIYMLVLRDKRDSIQRTDAPSPAI